jgi:hypothetical protein
MPDADKIAVASLEHEPMHPAKMNAGEAAETEPAKKGDR